MNSAQKRVKELFELFPNAEGMGRAYVLDFIEQRKADEGLKYNRIFRNDEEANLFMAGVAKRLKKSKDIAIFNELVILRQALLKTLRAAMFSRAIFFGSYYKIAGVTRGIYEAMSIASFISNPDRQISPTKNIDMIFYPTFDDDCRDLPLSWSTICITIRTILEETIYLEYLGDKYNFDFTVIYPEVNELIDKAKKVQAMAAKTLEILSSNNRHGLYNSSKKILKKITEDKPGAMSKNAKKTLRLLCFEDKDYAGNPEKILSYIQRNI